MKISPCMKQVTITLSHTALEEEDHWTEIQVDNFHVTTDLLRVIQLTVTIDQLVPIMLLVRHMNFI